MNKKRLTAYGLLLLVSMIWGVAGPVIKYTLNDFPPLIFLVYRFGISALVGTIVLITSHQKLPQTFDQWMHVIFYAMFVFVIGLTLLFFGFEQTTAITGTIVASTGPLFTAIAGYFFLKEKVTTIEKIGITIAIIGTIVTIMNADGYKEFGMASAISGSLIILLSNIFTAVGFAFSKKALNEDISPTTMTHVSFIISFFLLLPVMFIVYPLHEVITIMKTASLFGHLGVIYMALLSGTLAYFLTSVANSSIEIGEGAVFTYLQPIWAIPIAMLWLGEMTTIQQVVGGAIIGIGVCMAEYRKHKRHKKITPRRNK